MPLVVFVLAAAVFAQGTSEFMFSGLLGPIAVGTGVSIGTAGLLTSLFAVGMIVGAPGMAMSAGRWAARRSLAGFLLIFLLAHVIGATTTVFGVLLVTRAVAAVANAGFLAVTLAVLPALAGPDRIGRATSTVLSGVTLACVVGVPAGAMLGQRWGWQSALWGVALVALPALLATVWLVPGSLRPGAKDDVAQPDSAAIRREWRVVLDPLVRVPLLIGALVNAATFAAFTYLGVLITEVSGGAPQWIPIALALFGIGSFVGVTAAGRYADRQARRIVSIGTVVLVIIWGATSSVAAVLAALLVLTPIAGAAAFGVGSTVIGLIVRAATPAAPRLGGALATTALNIGAALGPAIAGIAIGRTGTATAAVWTSTALSVVAVVAAVRFSAAARPDRALRR
ncbi:MFS transporter [Nocardia terpenica]|uniref:Cmx/CmrA family chloramphenicol efflux MFS transporter n=1 Tax=Nocardia terpenica TaxID=455432 RepID=UPI001894D473|nr:Cmx/CmrA family chloramphenicol efflux MFS transporter [Nocardia terpenica]MBF6060222.1 MFS transporter [Nocardia terpenica]MBF6103482.1 MFS transporter [Nocardia terpenica]MBF6112144.1 MFS transporter [Nocardia terpenica]MBF6117703.1 MFS transporter [Nocardia terpenica]MBF6153553.1 MFS transporter [Nocardia terpenica]